MRRALVVALALVAVAACHRKVDTTSAPAQPSGPTYTLTVTNNLTKAVNVFVTNAGVDTFLSQVQGTSTAQVPVKGIAANTQVTLKATTSDGSSTYSKANVNLTNNYTWVLP
jgi:hypothetical protein